ncbi:unnamed protein product [Thelazia callipaeda]|uniref:Cystinosin homolog n=1 Tax=Thelazia callipaeda TaxID=103827 RepID=A0A0N5D425_THECL|nr:unnamed protein product [Thelazia callipaeda]
MTKMVTSIYLHVKPREIVLTVGEDKNVTFFVTETLPLPVTLTLRKSDLFDGTPHVFELNNDKRSANIVLTGIRITSYAIIEIEKCISANASGNFTNCPFSVVGLNFDFLLLNIVGFTCYTFYNVFMYFDSYVQEIYEREHPHSLIPVLLNDVVFALHALLACLVTALQCYFYTRGNQRISYTCWVLTAVFALIAVTTLSMAVIGWMNILQFIVGLSYIKMAVTLCKYFPQAYMNFRRKSTIGWSIGNVLLDCLGGVMDIIQMVLQGANTGENFADSNFYHLVMAVSDVEILDDWSIFYGNPVKFGLGLVSMIFDVLFMVQHYCLYRNADGGPPLRTSEGGTTEEMDFSDSNVASLPEVISVSNA